MTAEQLQIEYIDPIELIPHPDNAKIHTDKQIDRIAKSMTNTDGSIQPIVVDEEGVILAGHGRWAAHKKRGDVECPIIRKTGLTANQKKKFLLADNQTNAMTGNDFEAVSAILQSLDGDDVDIADIGFSEKELDKYLNYTEEEDERDIMEEAGEHAGGIRELKDSLNLGQDDLVGQYQLPKLLGRIAEFGDTEFVVWMNRHRTPPLAKGQMHYHLFGRESTKGLDPEQTLMAFYIDDVRFERMWTKLKENTQRMINADVYACVMPDFTRVDGWPLARNLWNVYRNFYTAAYWEAAGLQIVPNFCEWGLDSVEGCCAPIPEHSPTCSVQIQTIGGRTLRSGDGAVGLSEDDVRARLGLCLELVKPQTLLVYGGGPGLTLGAEICKRQGVRFVGIENRATAAVNLDQDRGF